MFKVPIVNRRKATQKKLERRAIRAGERPRPIYRRPAHAVPGAAKGERETAQKAGRLGRRRLAVAADGHLREPSSGRPRASRRVARRSRYVAWTRLAGAARAPDRARRVSGDACERRVDHVLLATGFRVEIGRYAFLPEDLLRLVNRIDGYPRLSRTFESSVPGLYFLGAPAAWSFGPLMRFVAGTEWAAQTLARGVEDRARVLHQ